jgi:metal-responsive CopG/Arc/MetJ family transcriptional regulator
VKTAISIPDATFARVEASAARLGVSRSEFFARAAERWLADLEDAQTTAAIDAVLATTSRTSRSSSRPRQRLCSTATGDRLR